MTKTTRNSFQQGDVCGQRRKSVPEGAKLISSNRCVLAEGETTGHAHVIEQKGAKLFEFKGDLFLDIKECATLLHEEHKPITLEPGIWEIGNVNEYDYFSKMVRKVQD